MGWGRAQRRKGRRGPRLLRAPGRASVALELAEVVSVVENLGRVARQKGEVEEDFSARDERGLEVHLVEAGGGTWRWGRNGRPVWACTRPVRGQVLPRTVDRPVEPLRVHEVAFDEGEHPVVSLLGVDSDGDRPVCPNCGACLRRHVCMGMKQRGSVGIVRMN